LFRHAAADDLIESVRHGRSMLTGSGRVQGQMAGGFVLHALARIGLIAEIFSRPVDGVVQATSVSVDPPGSAGVMSTGRSSSLPLWNTARARTSATRCGALTARQRVCAASISL